MLNTARRPSRPTSTGAGFSFSASSSTRSAFVRTKTRSLDAHRATSGSSVRQELALEPHVLFTGFREDVDHLLPWFDIFALTPIGAEALGTAYLEALAAGLPIVGSTIGGVGEIVSDEVGVLVPPRDVNALAGALLALISDEAARARRGRAARALAIDRFSTARMVESTLDLYRRTTSTPPQTT